MSIDYSKTIRLPKTDFPRRAGLAEKEPQLQQRWEKMGLYARQRAAAQGREKFILHMGPPFANGHIHLGHVLSTVLKDVVCRSHQMLGHDAPLVPGFDCHGLPIEWKIEEEFRAQGKNSGKDTDPVAFRSACRAFAQKWIETQSAEFQRLGILGDFKNPYITMDKKSEAMIAREIHKFLASGALTRGSKPVMWSIPEQTALAEAEVEYRDIALDTCYVRFPVKKGPPKLEGASVVIWTTTPWTLPGNRAIAYGEDIEYMMVVVGESANPLVKAGDKFVVALPLYDDFLAKTGIGPAPQSGRLDSGRDLAGTVCRHPLQGQGYDFDVPLLAGDFVTTDTGTGFVHIAPGHGEDDYRLVLNYNRDNPQKKIEIPQTVGPDGKYFDDVKLFNGLAVYTPDGKKGPANKLVLEAIRGAGNLVHALPAHEKGAYVTSYPHSWRSKAPVIFRNTPQWFISMEAHGLRQKALGAIRGTKWFPARGENRIAAMVEARGDWCVSRQRLWGVPLAIFVHRKTGQPLKDEKVLQRIYEIFLAEGIDAWDLRPAQDFLGADYRAEDFEQVKDIIDVWFESGCTQSYVLEQRPELGRPADLYLEGSDQHRGWFQSSLLVGCGTRGDAPYKNVLTHGFILDEKGYKMSKSQGNVTAPAELMKTYGADILRLWVAGCDYTEDIKFGENILKGHADVYRRIRGTFCYLLGSLEPGAEQLPYDGLSGLDRYILHLLHAVDAEVRACIARYDFHRLTAAVHDFCANDLSAFYFDICKDILYCEAPDSPRRRGVVTVLGHVFHHLAHWLAPVLCYTAEEAWLSHKGLGFDDLGESIHLSVLPPAPAAWRDEKLAGLWQEIKKARRVVTGALEVRRAEKMLGSALEAAPRVHVADTALAAALKAAPFADVCITSGIEVVTGAAPAGAFTLEDAPGIGVVVEKAGGDKCGRCWKYTPEVGQDAQHPALCARCAEVVRKELKSAA